MQKYMIKETINYIFNVSFESSNQNLCRWQLNGIIEMTSKQNIGKIAYTPVQIIECTKKLKHDQISLSRTENYQYSNSISVNVTGYLLLFFKRL